MDTSEPSQSLVHDELFPVQAAFEHACKSLDTTRVGAFYIGCMVKYKGSKEPLGVLDWFESVDLKSPVTESYGMGAILPTGYKHSHVITDLKGLEVVKDV